MGKDNLALPAELLGNVERYAVYRCYSDAGQLLYIGETGALGKRLASHAQKTWFLQVRGITLEWYADELDALNAERRAIHVEHPEYNVTHRNGTTPRPRPPAQRRPARSRDAITGHVRAVTMLQRNPDLTNVAIAAALGVSTKTVQRARTAIRKGTKT